MSGDSLNSNFWDFYTNYANITFKNNNTMSSPISLLLPESHFSGGAAEEEDSMGSIASLARCSYFEPEERAL